MAGGRFLSRKGLITEDALVIPKRDKVHKCEQTQGRRMDQLTPQQFLKILFVGESKNYSSM